MLALTVCTIVICVTIGVCVLGYQYLEKGGDVAWKYRRELSRQLDNISCDVTKALIELEKIEGLLRDKEQEG